MFYSQIDRERKNGGGSQPATLTCYQSVISPGNHYSYLQYLIILALYIQSPAFNISAVHCWPLPMSCSLLFVFSVFLFLLLVPIVVVRLFCCHNSLIFPLKEITSIWISQVRLHSGFILLWLWQHVLYEQSMLQTVYKTSGMHINSCKWDLFCHTYIFLFPHILEICFKW